MSRFWIKTCSSYKEMENQALAILCSVYFKIRHFKYQKSVLQARKTWLSLKEILASAQVKKMSFLPGYSGFNLNRNWHLSKVKINSTKRRSMGKVVFTQVKINYLKKMRFTDKTTYAQMMVLTRSKMASVLGRSTFLLQKSSILKNSDSLGNWVPL